jgi:hypothetical protein
MMTNVKIPISLETDIIKNDHALDCGELKILN